MIVRLGLMVGLKLGREAPLVKDYTHARLNMVNGHLRTNELVHPALVDAFSVVARESFVPDDRTGFAYIDEDLPLGSGRFLMDPMVLARLLQALDPQPAHTALIVGGAPGYSAALLARLVSTVVVLDSDAELVAATTTRFDQQALSNAVAVQGDLKSGYHKQGLYDAVLFDGAVDHIPACYGDQLAEGGRIAAVVRDPTLDERQQLGQACLFEKSAGGQLTARVLFDANTPLLPGFEKEKTFAF